MTARPYARAVPAAVIAAVLAAAPVLAQTDTQSPAAQTPPVPTTTLPMTAAPAPAAPTANPQAAEAQSKPMTKPQTVAGRQEAAKVEQHIAELHRRLHITPAEQPQWEAFAQTMRENAVHMDQMFKARADAEGMNAVDDLKSYAAIAQAHAEDMQHLLPAFEALYSAMSPDQQKAADAAFKQFESRGMRRATHG